MQNRLHDCAVIVHREVVLTDLAGDVKRHDQAPLRLAAAVLQAKAAGQRVLRTERMTYTHPAPAPLRTGRRLTKPVAPPQRPNVDEMGSQRQGSAD